MDENLVIREAMLTRGFVCMAISILYVRTKSGPQDVQSTVFGAVWLVIAVVHVVSGLFAR